jgi:MFS family permease
VRLIVAAALGFVGFVTSFGAHVVAVNLPAYAETVGVGVAVIGLLIAVYDFAEVLAKPVFGAVADRRGMRATMLAGIAVFTLASLLYLVLPPQLLLLVRFLQGLGAAALSAVSLALIGVYFIADRGRAYGVYNAIKGAGYVVSPAIGGLLVVQSGFATIFLATAVIGVVAFAIALLLPRPPATDADAFDDDDDFSVSGFLAVFREPLLRPWYAVTIVNMFLVGILFGFLPVRLHDLGADALASGTLLSVVAASYLLVQPVAGALADRVAAAATIRAGLLVAAACVIAIPLVTGPALVLIVILAGAGVGVVWTNTDTAISRLAADGRLGATMGAAGSFKELGDMAGPLTIGIVSQAFGLTAGFVSCGLLGLAALALIRPAPRASGT